MELTLEEESCLVSNQVTRKVLRCVDQAGDDGSSQVSSLEQVKKGRRSSHLSLDLDGSLHHGQGLLGCLIFVTETLDGAESILLAPAADEPPWRLGGQETEDQEGGL